MTGKINKVVVLLGDENDEDKSLSETAELRADAAIDFLKENNDYVVIPTGSFGKHFNASSTPHGKILSSYLIDKGISPEIILPHTRTSNTLEGAFGVLRCLNSMESVGKVHIITSAFHMMRVKYIFSRILQQYDITYQELDNPLDETLLSKKIAHEKRSISRLKKEWVDISNYDLGKFPDKCYENLGKELTHYDNVSYLVIAGAFIIFSFFFTGNGHGVSGGLIIVVVLLWYLYLRFANTAASARRVLIIVEKLYGVPGLSSTQHNTKFFGINMRVKRAISIIFLSMIFGILHQLFVKICT
ncbi:MAG: YdcF family protein [Bacteroidetes bacterium]|nr:YdcF family protein [Bacteroidota bacterium]